MSFVTLKIVKTLYALKVGNIFGDCLIFHKLYTGKYQWIIFVLTLKSLSNSKDIKLGISFSLVLTKHHSFSVQKKTQKRIETNTKNRVLRSSTKYKMHCNKSTLFCLFTMILLHFIKSNYLWYWCIAYWFRRVYNNLKIIPSLRKKSVFSPSV